MTISARIFYWFFSFVVVALAFRWALPGGVAANIPAMDYHLQDRKALLYLHMIGSLIPMAFIPFQIWNGFRMKRPAMHRWMGRASVLGIYVGGLSLIPLAVYIPVPDWGRFGFMLAGSLWMAAASVGLYYIIVKRNMRLHRWWMMITAAIIFGAVTQRFALPIWITVGFDWKIAYSLSAYSGFSFNLTLFFLWQYRKKIGVMLGKTAKT